MTHQPFIVGIGGTASPFSSTEQALALALASAERLGATTRLFGGAHLSRLPLYLTASLDECEGAKTLVDDLRRADGVIIASPGYHGSISGLVKNAIDYLEELARDQRVYLSGLPVGLIATAYGWQATNTTLATLRSITHALRGWPTPMGAAINVSGGIFSSGECTDAKAFEMLEMIGTQVVDFATSRQAA